MYNLSEVTSRWRREGGITLHTRGGGVAEMYVRVFHLLYKIAGLRVRLSSAFSCCVLQMGGREVFEGRAIAVRTTAEQTGEEY